MPSLSVVRAANIQFATKSLPVALFVGGTAGIGRAMAEAFARYSNGNAHIIICGRNREAAERIIASFPKPTPAENAEQPVHKFVQCDATLMKNVHATSTELLGWLTKLNFLVLSPGYITFLGRDETEEGLDRKMALNYYARWKFTNELMPLLCKAKDAGEDAKVFSVLGAGMGGEIDLNDLGLKKTYSPTKCALTTPTYNDLMLEEFANQQPDIAFTQAYPGLVRTDIMKPTHWAFRWLSPIIRLLVYPVSVSPDICAEYMLWAMFDGKKGVFRRGEHGDDIGKKNYHGSEDARKKLWEHTAEAVKV